MDSEHRHELKENDLAVAMATLKDWWGKHQMKVLGGAVVLAALILAIRYFSASATATRDGEQYELATAPTPDAYRSLAQDTSSDAVRLHANLRGADAVLPLVRKPIGTGAEAITAEKKKQLLDQAATMYQSVLSEAKHPLLRIKARLGLAAVAETRGEWDKAKEQYQAVQKEPGEGLDFLKKRAAAFEEALARIKVEPVYGKEAPKDKPLTGGDRFPFPFDPGVTTDAKDGKDDEDTKDSKDGFDPNSGLLFPPLTPDKDGKEPAPVPAKDAKEPEPAPTPAKDAKTPEPAPAKDGK